MLTSNLFLILLHVFGCLQFMHAPLHTFWNALKSATRSTCFLSAFVGIYQVFTSDVKSPDPSCSVTAVEVKSLDDINWPVFAKGA